MSTETAILKKINLSELVEKDFIIPNYQRAFRWQEDEINLLLDDIYAAKKLKSVICLQPLVVKKSGEKYEVIDGQQRLTSIFLIILYLNNNVYKTPNPLYTISYSSRDLDLCKVIDGIDINDYIDKVLIKKGYKTINLWFENHRKENLSIHEDIFSALVNNIFFIWYLFGEDVETKSILEIEGEESIEMFLRLNIGKIKLTDSELIKAWILNRINDEENSKDKQDLTKIPRMKEWDDFEQRLRDDSFWFFLSSISTNYYNANRIAFIFEKLLNINHEEGRYTLFYSFIKEYKDCTTYEIWLKVKGMMLTFIDWYEDRELYHYVGLLTAFGIGLSTIISIYEKSADRKLFKINLIKLIKKNLKINDLDFDIIQYLQDINYNDNKENIVKILLTFNIFSILEMENSYSRFPFYNYHTVAWDIEHVHSQTDDKISSKDDYVKWITLNKAIFQQLPDQNKDLIYDFDNIEKDSEAVLKEKYNKLVAIAGEHYKTNESTDLKHLNIHSIANLALLDAKTNRSYKNSVFLIKRKTILQNEKEGTFIPICTRNIFLKAYSKTSNDPFRWTTIDMSDYFDAIKVCLESIGNKYE